MKNSSNLNRKAQIHTANKSFRFLFRHSTAIWFELENLSTANICLCMANSKSNWILIIIKNVLLFCVFRWKASQAWTNRIVLSIHIHEQNIIYFSFYESLDFEMWTNNNFFFARFHFLNMKRKYWRLKKLMSLFLILPTIKRMGLEANGIDKVKWMKYKEFPTFTEQVQMVSKKFS